MSVREKAKAFEGHASDDSDTHPNLSPPIPPPRKYKKNGTLRQEGDSSPSTERKENIPKPASSSSLPTKQSNVTEQKKKPKPPPPLRGSSLRRKAAVPANLQSGSSGKKPRPPIPPKPKNYVPKRKSLGQDITVKNKVQQDVRSTKEITDSAPVVPDSGQSGHCSSQFSLNLEEGNYTGNIHKKFLDSENSSQFFVPVDKNVPSDTSVRTGITASALSANTGGETIHSLENGKADQFENDLALPQARSVFYDHKILSPDEDSGKESPDLLEGLEIDVEPFSEDDEEDLNKAAFGLDKENLPFSDSKGFNAIVARDNFDVVVKEQSYEELKPSDRGNDSKENVKVMFSLVLEEECSVSMIDDAAESQKLVDITVNETTNFEQTTEGQASDGINQINISELSNEANHGVDHKLRDAAVEVTTSQECQNVSSSIVAEPLHTSDIDIENSPETPKAMEENSISYKIDTAEPLHICDLDIESSPEAAKVMGENSISDNLDADEPSYICDLDIESSPEAAKVMGENSISDNLDAHAQRNICAAVRPVEELSQTSLEQKESLESDLHLVSQGHEMEKKEEESSHEIDTNASTDLAWSEAQENREIIVAEPIREGTFISVSDHGIFEGKAEVTEASTINESGIEVSHSSERYVSVPDITVVTNTDFETPTEEDKGEFEDEQEVNASQIQSIIVETSSDVNSENFELKMDSEEKSREHLLVVNINEVVAEDSATNSKEPEELEAEKIPSASVAEHMLVETAEDAAVSSVDDFGHSTKILEGTEITATHVRTVDNKEEQEPEESKNEGETQPSSPEPVPPERPNRKAKRGRHAYENVDLCISEVEKQADEKRSDSLARRAHSFSKYESVVHSLPRPVQRVSDDEAIYRVPSKVIPVRSNGDDDAVYSVPFAIPAHCVVEESKYSVPKPIVVQASAVTDRLKADEVGEVYAVPGLPTAVPVTERSEKTVVTEVPQESDSIYVVPGKQTVVPTVTATTSAVPPPKPPRLSLVFDHDKKEKVDVVKTSSVESPKPVPRTRGAGSDVASEVGQSRGSPTPAPRKGNKIEVAESPTPKVKEQKASPSPVPRNGSKTEASESETKEHKASPSLVPRKGSKTAETSETPEAVTPQGNGSPAPVPRDRLNALQLTREATSPLPVRKLSSDVSVEESMKEESTSKRKSLPPPRPPPPVTRISFTNSEGTMPTPLVHGLGNDLESDSDSDIGEEEVPKGPPKPKTFFIAHEILSTERTFVDALKLVFEECYGAIKSANIVADSVLADIFRDLENIYLLDSRFLQELEDRMATWEEHEKIGDIIKRYGHFLKMYTQYVNGYDKAMAVFQDTMKENPEFADLVTQFQASERCHGMVLSSYMLKPVQRIPSYRLLLMDYLKHLRKDSEEFKDTETTLKIVSEVATHINESMKKMDSFEQLLKLQNMLVGHPEIVKAGRDYLREGLLMKLCRKDMQERMFFLLTDVLLYTTPMGGNQFKLNKMLPLLGMQVTVPESPDLVNEFSIISTTRSFTLTASTPEERDDWVEALNKAIDEVTKRKITFVSKTRDAAGLLEQEGDTAKLGEKAPVWIPDARVTMCMSCTKPFTVTNRRHHCRACGNVVCGSCSESTAPLAYLDYTQARVCDKCYDLLLKEFHTVEIHVDLEEPAALPPLLEEADNAEKLLRKPTKFEMMRRFKSRKTKRKSQIMHPTHLTEVVANQEGIQMSGYLRCKKGRYGWKKSWFVLKDSVVYSYKASSDVVALDTLPVLGYSIDDMGKEGDDFVFQLKHQGVSPIIFKADNETSAKRWIEELTKATTM